MKHALPMECFQKVFSELQVGDAVGVERDTDTGLLKATKVTPTLHKYQYSIKKGSVSDKIFNLSTLDVAPPEPKIQTVTTPAVTVAPGDEPDVYEVEAIVGKRTIKGRVQYHIKWAGWDESTWEAASRVHPDLVREYEGKPARLPRPQQSSSTVPFKRGAGCARARLSKADQRRGGVPETISMIAGNVEVLYSVPKNKLKCLTIKITFGVLTMNKHGFITWPTEFDLNTKAQLRKQARILLRKMMDDPFNPVDDSMAPALTQQGGAVRVPPPPTPASARA